MRVLEIKEMARVAGGLNLDNGRLSANVIDWRGATYQPNYVDANGMCWPLPTGSTPAGKALPDPSADGDEE